MSYTSTIHDFKKTSSRFNYDTEYIDIFGKPYSNIDCKSVNLGGKMDLTIQNEIDNNPYRFGNNMNPDKYELQAKAITNEFSKVAYQNEQLENIGEEINPFIKLLSFGKNINKNVSTSPENMKLRDAETRLTNYLNNLSSRENTNQMQLRDVETILNPITKKAIKIGAKTHMELISKGIID